MGGVCGKENIKKKEKVKTNLGRDNPVVPQQQQQPILPVENIFNVSINDEFSSRQIMHCNRCNYNFPNQREYNQHFNYCGVIRNNHEVHHSLAEILHLVNSLNRHLQNDNRLALMALLGHDEPEECLEYFDWEYKNNSWIKTGKIQLSSKIFF